MNLITPTLYPSGHDCIGLNVVMLERILLKNDDHTRSL